jgi:hypothetical protein
VDVAVVAAFFVRRADVPADRELDDLPPVLFCLEVTPLLVDVDDCDDDDCNTGSAGVDASVDVVSAADAEEDVIDDDVDWLVFTKY